MVKALRAGPAVVLGIGITKALLSLLNYFGLAEAALSIYNWIPRRPDWVDHPLFPLGLIAGGLFLLWGQAKMHEKASVPACRLSVCWSTQKPIVRLPSPGIIFRRCERASSP